MTGLVSVVVPTYNRAYCLPQALDSVLAQSYANLEIVLVDDGSTDDTRALVQQRWQHEPRVRYIHQPNGGVSAARNRGLREARGSFIALLDSDDTWMPWKLQAQIACLDAFPEAGMIWSDMKAIDPDGRVLDERYLRRMYQAYRWFPPGTLFPVTRRLGELMSPAPEPLRDATVGYGEIFSPMVMGNLVHTSTVLLRRARYEQVGLFDETMRTGEDYDFHLRTCRAGPVAFLDAASIRYQCGRADQLSRPEFTLEIARNFVRTVHRTLERDRAQVALPKWMIRRCLADGHLWVGETALAAGQHRLARANLAASLRYHPRQPRTLLLLASALPPAAVGQWLRRGFRGVKRALRPGGA
ncbi:MAG TPA: glycosyltransferase [Steroidobacteraceae bacterium]|nr:glycosyltransferase [Steroidobacteraceae bacterium]